MDVPRSFAWRPKTTFILIGGFSIIVVALVVAFVVDNFRPTVSVQAGSGYYNVWLADDEAERIKGLSGVKKLDINGGLLMDFKTDGKWGIWMKDMEVPLDIIWANKSRVVVHIKRDVSPDLGTSQSFEPKEPARYVLELPAGSVSKAGIKVGQELRFQLGDEE